MFNNTRRKTMNKNILLWGVVILLFLTGGIAQAQLQVVSDINGYFSAFEDTGSLAEWERDAQPIAASYWIYSGFPAVQSADGSFNYTNSLTTPYYTSPTLITTNALASYFPTFSTESDMLQPLGTAGDIETRCARYTIWNSSATWTPPVANQTRIFGCRFTIPATAPLVLGLNFSLRTNQAQILDANNVRVQDAFRPALTVNIVDAVPPIGFAGPTRATSVQSGTPPLDIGNTVQIEWGDINGLAPDIFTREKTPPITYDLYVNAGNADFNPGANGDESRRVTIDIHASTSIIIGGRGIPNSAQANDLANLSDCKAYTFRMRAKDSVIASARNDLGRHKTVDAGTAFQTVTPHDLTPPAAPTNARIAAVNDNYLNVAWDNPGDNDFRAFNSLSGGIVVLRKVGGASNNPPPPSLIGASGNNHGEDLTSRIGENYNNTGWFVYKVFSNAATTNFDETAATVQNGTVYNYAIYAYDAAGPGDTPDASNTFQQGRNYSPPAIISGTPGKSPSRVQNFVALTGPGNAITLNWNNSPEPYYGGAVILGTANVNLLEGMIYTDYLSNLTYDPNQVILIGRIPAPAEGVANELLVSNFGIDSNLQPLPNTPISPETKYYFKAFAYNRGPVEGWNPFVADEIATHQFSAGEIAGSRVIAATQPVTISVTLHKEVAGSGLNTLAFPFDTTKEITINGVRLVATNVQGLIQAINSAAGDPALISSFGWFDRDQQLQYGLTSIVYSGPDIGAGSIFTPSTADPKTLLNSPIDSGAGNSDSCFSVGVNRDFTFTMTGIKKQ